MRPARHRLPLPPDWAAALARLPRPDAEIVEGLKRGLLIGAAAAAVLLPPAGIANLRPPTASSAAAQAVAPPAPLGQPRLADFGALEAPDDVRRIADWAADSGDAGPMDYIVLDKRRAHVYVFAPDGRLRAHTPVLLGAAPGDDSVEGIGQKPLHEVRPEERTTPAGRFVGQSGLNAHGEDVFWIDYQAAVSMHRVRELEPSERRLHRLATPTVDDNRISYGCVNLPAEFFETVMLPTFKGRRAMVYVLPEARSFAEVFPMAYDVAARHAAARGRPAM